jgi:hypothetical protein
MAALTGMEGLMNRLLSVTAFAICLILGSAAAQAQQWQEYRPDGMGFRVEFPGSAQIEDNTAKAGNNVSKMIIASVAPSDEIAYIAMYSVFKPSAVDSDPQKSLDGGMRGLTSQGKIRSQKRLTFGTAPARYVVIDMSETRVGIDLMVMSGNTLIQIICIMPTGQEATPVVERIYKSFALVAN